LTRVLAGACTGGDRGGRELFGWAADGVCCAAPLLRLDLSLARSLTTLKKTNKPIGILAEVVSLSGDEAIWFGVGGVGSLLYLLRCQIFLPFLPHFLSHVLSHFSPIFFLISLLSLSLFSRFLSNFSHMLSLIVSPIFRRLCGVLMAEMSCAEETCFELFVRLHSIENDHSLATAIHHCC